MQYNLILSHILEYSRMSSATKKHRAVDQLRLLQQGGLNLNQDRVQAICNSVDGISNRVGGNCRGKPLDNKTARYPIILPK